MGPLRTSWRRVGLVLGHPVRAVGLHASTTARTDLPHLTIWDGDVSYADTNPDIVDWVGYGTFAYIAGLGGCSIVDGGNGWTGPSRSTPSDRPRRRHVPTSAGRSRPGTQHIHSR